MDGQADAGRAFQADGIAFRLCRGFVAVLVMAAVEHAVRQSGVPFPVRDFFIAFLCVNEALSCMEHLAFFGVPFPHKLRGRLRKYRDAIFNEENKA